MGEIKNSTKGVKSGVPERVSISCPTCDTRHDLLQITGNKSYLFLLYQIYIALFPCLQYVQKCICQLVNKPFNICDTKVSNV